MSRERAKGTAYETEFLRAVIRQVWPSAVRTGSNHSTEWGSADYMMTGGTAWEVKNWKDWSAAIRRGWPQAVQHAKDTGKVPYLAVKMPQRGVLDSLVITTAGEWLKQHPPDAGLRGCGCALD